MILFILYIADASVTVNTAQTNDYATQDFHYAINNSNLIVKCLDPTNELVRKANFKPISYFSKPTTINAPKYISDHKKYPYKLYAKQYSTKYYLGAVKHGKFKPANNYAGGVFYKYLQYIHQHHLENKFKHTIYFEQDGRYLDGDDVQWALTNNHDIVLHLNDNTIVKQTDVINN